MRRGAYLRRIWRSISRSISINAAAAPYGVVSLIIIMLIGGGIYFLVLPRYLDKA